MNTWRRLPARPGYAWFIVAACVLLAGSHSAFGLLPFPLAANQRGTVTCLENPSYTYDIYLPPGYSLTGSPRPILYTMYANGGGMVSSFQNACLSKNMIVVGITGTQNGVSWNKVIREIYAVTRDVRQRVLYDPTAEYAGGFSGGGECSYMFARMRSQHVAGVFEMAGWLGRVNLGVNVNYYGVDRLQTNLLIFRTSGSTDTGAQFYDAFDRNFLTNYSAVIKDNSFSGGHAVPPDVLKIAGLSWLLTNRIPAGASDRFNSEVLFTNWQTRISAGQSESVLRECVSNLVTFPRSWVAYQPQLTLDVLLTNYSVFRTLNVSNLAQGNVAADFFYFYAYGAATNGDWQRYNSCMKALTGIIVTNDYDGTVVIDGFDVPVIFPGPGTISITYSNGDRAGDIYNLLTNYNRYPRPQIQFAPASPPGLANLWLVEDTPGLAYTAQWRTNLTDDVWQDLPATGVDTNTIWSAAFDPVPDSDRAYYRVKAEPVPGYSARWVGQ